MWESAFGSASDIIGRPITLGRQELYRRRGDAEGLRVSHSKTLVPALWTSLSDDAYDPGGEPMTSERGAHLLDVVGRLKPGVSAEQARADLDVIAQNLRAQYPNTNLHFVGSVVTTELETPCWRYSSSACGFLFRSGLFCVAHCMRRMSAGLLLARAYAAAVRSSPSAPLWERAEIRSSGRCWWRQWCWGYAAGWLAVVLATALLRVTGFAWFRLTCRDIAQVSV